MKNKFRDEWLSDFMTVTAGLFFLHSSETDESK